jgi:hypothetical protein
MTPSKRVGPHDVFNESILSFLRRRTSKKVPAEPPNSPDTVMNEKSLMISEGNGYLNQAWGLLEGNQDRLDSALRDKLWERANE